MEIKLMKLKKDSKPSRPQVNDDFFLSSGFKTFLNALLEEAVQEDLEELSFKEKNAEKIQ